MVRHRKNLTKYHGVSESTRRYRLPQLDWGSVSSIRHNENNYSMQIAREE